jgi:hypothetical protein
MLQPAATEAAFSVNGSNAITASYQLVLGEGPIESLGLRDVTQNGVRRDSSWMQTYNRRAGSWTPGNSITIPAAGTDYRKASYVCGGGSAGYGSYAGLSTLSYTITCAVGDEAWQGQVAAFVRGGLQVTRLVDGIYGSSSNIVDLIKYLLLQTARIPAALIDTASLTAAAQFTEANGFRFDGVIMAAANLSDWLAQVLPYFLLKESCSNGKFGLLPVVPINNNGTISANPVPVDWAFTDRNIVADSFEIEYIPLAERKAFCAQMIWRQQDECQWPLMRTTEVRYNGEALSGPFEQHDVSAWITNEDHSCKAGSFLLARRRYVSHTARVVLLPGAVSRAITAGDIIRLQLERTSSTGSFGEHNRLYQVQRIRQTVVGEIALELLHFPVNSDGVSLVAIDVANAAGNGLRLTSDTSTSPETYGCTNATVPADTSTAVTAIADDYLDSKRNSAGRESNGSGSVAATGGTAGDDAGGGGTDPLGDRPQIQTPYGRPPANGETISVPASSSSGDDCPNPQSQWLKGTFIDEDGNINWEEIIGAVGPNLTITGVLGVAGQNVAAVFTCDGSTPTPTNGVITEPVIPGVAAPANPYDPLPPYFVNIQQWYFGPGGPKPAVDVFGSPKPIIKSYGPYGLDVRIGSFNGRNDRWIVNMWYTSSNGAKNLYGTFIDGWLPNADGSYSPTPNNFFTYRWIAAWA